ncbi:MAG: hypothetical protein HQM02_13060, partial [Magnetococcales bacterium]|nr:hypothetical protein [Magnetococcales bacterium]
VQTQNLMKRFGKIGNKGFMRGGFPGLGGGFPGAGLFGGGKPPEMPS